MEINATQWVFSHSVCSEIDDSVGGLLADHGSEAIVNRLEQVTAFEDFAGGIDDFHVKAWTLMAQQWEANSSLENPFESTGDGGCYFGHRSLTLLTPSPEITKASVHTEMADEDTEAISKGKFKDLGTELTPSQFILQGVELEESMYVQPLHMSLICLIQLTGVNISSQ